MMHADIPPNQTIYVNNLNDRVKKEELKRSLYCLFSQYGRILDVVALKTSRLRGQAWIVFDEITAASSALRQMQGFPFYDKPMRIQYGKSKSDAIAKADGSYLPRDKRKKQEEKVEKKRKEQDAPHAGNGAPRSYESNMDSKSQNQQRKSNGQEAPASPNSILFIQNLPHETTTMMLQLLFEQYPGFKEVRMVDAKPGIAFIEYIDDMQSTVAMQALQGFKITPQNPMLISYAKK